MLILQVGGAVQGSYIKGSSRLHLHYIRRLELLRDPAAVRLATTPGLGWGQPDPTIAWFSLTLIMTRMSQIWCHCDTVLTSTTCLMLLTLIDHL